MEANENLEEQNTASSDFSKDKLMEDLKTLMRDAEALLKATAHGVGEKAQEARERLAVALEKAKASYQQLEEKAREGAKVTDRVIREHPYQSIGVAFGIGLLIGVLVNRK